MFFISIITVKHPIIVFFKYSLCDIFLGTEITLLVGLPLLLIISYDVNEKKILLVFIKSI